MMARSNRKSARGASRVASMGPRMEWKSDGVSSTNAVDAAAELERLLNSRTAEGYHLASIISNSSIEGLVALFHRVADEDQEPNGSSPQTQHNTN